MAVNNSIIVGPLVFLCIVAKKIFFQFSVAVNNSIIVGPLVFLL